MIIPAVIVCLICGQVVETGYYYACGGIFD